ncbi:MAG: hypothetical protein OXF61_09135 [Acidimicrobiaceae bacterium]|nr:hypothetical protein [Acidimicrobiaceae bacterium]
MGRRSPSESGGADGFGLLAAVFGRLPDFELFEARAGFVAEAAPCSLLVSGALTARTVPFTSVIDAENSGGTPAPGPPFTVEAFAVEAVTSDGIELEAEAAWPGSRRPQSAGSDDGSSGGTAAAVAVLSHPHPLYGGDMWNPLVDHLFRALPASGIAALRYNFRGTGRSGGSHDDGKAERLDAAAAFDAAVRLAADRSGTADPPPVVSAGWSFGGDVSLAAGHDALSAWIGIAAPLRIVDPAEMTAPRDPRPKLLLVPEHDQFRAPAEATDIASGWTNTRLEVIPGGDHFLMGHARAVVEHIATFARGL